MGVEDGKKTISTILARNQGASISPHILWDYLFVFSLIFPLGLASFFNPASSLGFKSVVNLLELVAIGVFFLRGKKNSLQESGVGLNIYGFIFIFWLIWGVFSVFHASNVPQAAIRQMEWVVHILFGCVIFFFLKEKFDYIRFIYLMPIAGFLVIAVSLVVFWFLTQDPSHYDWLRPPFFTHIRHLTFFAVAVLLLSPPKKERLWVWLPALTVTWGVLFWSGGRAGVLVACFGICLISLLRRQWNLLFYHAAAAFLGFQLSLFFPVYIKWLGFGSALDRTAGSTGLNKLLSGRPDIWAWSFRSLKGNWLFGIGPEGFRYLIRSQEIRISQPHGTWVQIFLEWGIPGGLAFLLLQVKGLVVIWRNRGKILENDYATGCFALIFGFALFSFVDGVYYHSLPMMLLAYGYAVVFAYINIDPSQKTFTGERKL